MISDEIKYLYSKGWYREGGIWIKDDLAMFWQDAYILETKKDILDLEMENTILRGIAAKIMPCHYCGVDTVSKCPHGFPGCSLMDDLLFAQDKLMDNNK